jgi:hypothetical protein
VSQQHLIIKLTNKKDQEESFWFLKEQVKQKFDQANNLHSTLEQ